MRTLFIQWHLGLGDALVCNALARYMAATRHHITLPAKEPNLISVSFMFSDVPNISVLPVVDDKDSLNMAFDYPSIRLGMFNKRKTCNFTTWDKQLYEQAGVPFEIRWSEFKLPHVNQTITPPVDPYIFIHEDVDRGFVIKKERLPSALTTYVPTQTKSIFEHLTALQNASEIHCIDSCFAILADSVECKAKRYVLHLYARPGAKPPSYKKNWEIIR